MSEPEQRPYRIVVGFDGSENSKRDLIWAAAEAKRREGFLEIVRAWTAGEFGSHTEMGQIAQKHLDADVASVLGEQSEIELVMMAQNGHAAKVLLEHGRGADMLVVGSRGRDFSLDCSWDQSGSRWRPMTVPPSS